MPGAGSLMGWTLCSSQRDGLMKGSPWIPCFRAPAGPLVTEQIYIITQAEIWVWWYPVVLAWESICTWLGLDGCFEEIFCIWDFFLTCWIGLRENSVSGYCWVCEFCAHRPHFHARTRSVHALSKDGPPILPQRCVWLCVCVYVEAKWQPWVSFLRNCLLIFQKGSLPDV